ncbi:hypothetical protein ACJRO7_004663 [Eucalyptus globulus]|uniref:Uncharacterized protein n=1 Tax=Eucalyptus globulus TaxID=34317 RepID=A0ABD3IXC4_EUCGL
MLTEETLFSMSQEELETVARHLRASIRGFWPLLRQWAGLHVVLACVLVFVSPSELHCLVAWKAVALVFMIAGLHLVNFVMLMLRLMQRYAELEAVEVLLRRPLVAVEGGAGRRGGRSKRALYATLAMGHFVIFTVSTAWISRLLACPDR